MALLLSDDLEGRGTSPTTDVTEVTTSNTHVSTVTGTGTSSVCKFSTSAAMDGSLGLKFTCSSNYFYCYYSFTAAGITWFVFKLRMTAAPSGNIVIAQAHGNSGADKQAELRVNSDRTLVVRDGASVVTGATSPALSLSTEYRVEWGVDRTNGDTFLDVYEGDSATPWSTDSDTTVTMHATTTTVDTLRLGPVANITWDAVHIDSLYVYSDAVPSSDSATFDLSATYVTDTTDIDEWVLDATASVGTTSLTQTAGTSVGTVTESPTGVFTFSNPANSDQLKFDLDAGSDTIEVNIWRRNRPAVLTLVGGVLR